MIKLLPIVIISLLTPSCVTIHRAADESHTTEQHLPSSDEPAISIKSGDKLKKFTRTALLSSPALIFIHVPADPAYKGQPTTYKAIPVTALFSDFAIAPGSVITFTCLDGFSAPIAAERLFDFNKKANGSTQQGRATAYLAIETASAPWPAVKAGDTKSAGPFYLIWQNPEYSKVVADEWPFQLAQFEVKGSIASQFPQTLPDPKFASDSAVSKGYKTFMQNCFACHTMNKNGQSQLGPDLNVPMNPTEYLGAKYIEKLVRDPQDLRHWPQSKMAAFDRKSLPDQDLHDLISYLKHMATRKVK